MDTERESRGTFVLHHNGEYLCSCKKNRGRGSKNDLQEVQEFECELRSEYIFEIRYLNYTTTIKETFKILNNLFQKISNRVQDHLKKEGHLMQYCNCLNQKERKE